MESIPYFAFGKLTSRLLPECFGDTACFRLLAVVINSLYSFWWDLTNDWGLEILQPRSSLSHPPRTLVLPSLQQRVPPVDASFSHPDGLPTLRMSSTNRAYPSGLRPVLLYPFPVYTLIICLNLVLRMTWSIKLSSHLHLYSEGSSVIFWIEVAELLRRWMWVFLRIEWEVVKKGKDRERTPDSYSGMELFDAGKEGAIE